MRVTTFAARDLDRLRRRAQSAALLPPDGPEGWSESPVNPMDILAVFDTLRIMSGYTLRGYQYRAGHDGNGIVWAMPAAEPLPPPDRCPQIADGLRNAPRPVAALDDVMLAIQGDASPLSYLSASLLARELAEFGATWHGISWGADRILHRRPPMAAGREQAQPGADPSRWTWLMPPPNRWRPEVSETADGVSVTFHVLSNVGMERITRITDSFGVGQYTFTTAQEDVAIGGVGIIF